MSGALFSPCCYVDIATCLTPTLTFITAAKKTAAVTNDLRKAQHSSPITEVGGNACARCLRQCIRSRCKRDV